jgi:hypothetical protein
MSDLKAQEFYQLYRKKTIEAGFTPIGRQRFTGIIKTLSLIPETFEYIQNKANGDNSKPANCAIFDVVGQSEQLICPECENPYPHSHTDGSYSCEDCGHKWAN